MILNLITSTDQIGTVIMTCTPEESKWTTIQQRVNGSLNFMRSWTEYEEGFGSIENNYWAGLESMYHMTESVPKRLRILLEHFDRSVPDVAFYETFAVGNAASKYQLSISGFTGNIGDSLATSNNMMFTTPDHDNDMKNAENCAAKFKCSWWLNQCFYACLNGEYQEKADTGKFAIGIIWMNPKGFAYSYKRSIMSIV